MKVGVLKRIQRSEINIEMYGKRMETRNDSQLFNFTVLQDEEK